jgi:hypothetical protein
MQLSLLSFGLEVHEAILTSFLISSGNDCANCTGIQDIDHLHVTGPSTLKAQLMFLVILPCLGSQKHPLQTRYFGLTPKFSLPPPRVSLGPNFGLLSTLLPP